MFKGALIMESLRVGTRLSDLNLVVREIYRFQPEGTSADQPGTWSVAEVEVQDDEVAGVAQSFADALSQPGWYVGFRSDTEVLIVYPGRIFRYARGDEAGRAQAQAHGRLLGVPERQLDWTV